MADLSVGAMGRRYTADVPLLQAIPAEVPTMQREGDGQVKIAPQISSAEKMAGMKEAAQKFESYYIYMMLKAMRKTVPEGGILSSGLGHDVYTSMYDEAIADEMARTGSLGLSKLLMEQYMKSEGEKVKSSEVSSDKIDRGGK